MKIKSLCLALVSVTISHLLFAQIVVDHFDSTANSTWVSGSTKIVLTSKNGVLNARSNSAGPAYEGFGNYFTAIDMSRHAKLSVKIMVPKDSVAPTIRLDLCDNNGYFTNGSIVSVTPVADSIFHEYVFDFTNKFYSTYPASNLVNASKIVRLYMYFNPGGSAFKGNVIFDDFVVLGAQSPNLISEKSTWSYLDNGKQAASNWTDTTFTDTSWKNDTALLGYGENQKTTIDFGTDASKKYITTYFRKTFTIVDTATYKNLIVNLVADDGAVLYLNGKEVARYNMPQGIIDSSTLAVTEISDSKIEKAFQRFILPESLLNLGSNVLAIEVHQASANTDDMSFDASLFATDSKSGLLRCPYLQMGSQTGIMIRWRTLESTASRVRYGLSPTNLSSIVDSNFKTDEHKVILSNLSPETKYYYSVGNLIDTLSGADTSHYFVTAPQKGKEMPINIWAIGDAGYGILDQRKMRDAYYKYIGPKHTNVWLILGDNAYSDGRDDEHQLGMFENMFENMLAKTVVWSTPGNHDIRKFIADPIGTAPYYKIFSTPQNAEAGGVASHNPGYYSFDYGNIHFISLETNQTPRYDTSAMALWLKKDLAANTSKWTITFMHHPPYSKGSHNSDDTIGEDLRCTEMRKYIVPILENGGVDFVITGHSHVYERSYMIHGQYDSSATFLDAPHIMNAQSSGRKDSNEVYYKNPTDLDYPNIGTVYNVMGCSGFIESTIYWQKQLKNLITNALMYTYSNKFIGSMAIAVNKDTLTARFLDKTGVVRDNYTIVKDATKKMSLVMAHLKTEIRAIKSDDKLQFSVFPNPTTSAIAIKYTLEKRANVSLELFDLNGRLLKSFCKQNQDIGDYLFNYQFDNEAVTSYIVVLKIDGKLSSKQIIRTQK
jgi:hypothetical protein